jgi:glycosyltransferase involved in cell wall biosynthesis
VFFALDFQPQVQHAQAGFYQKLRQQGVTVKFMVYDLLCILQPEHFPEGASQNFIKWLEVVGESDGAICISQAVAGELKSWMNEKQWARMRPFYIDINHLGADLDGVVPVGRLPQSSDTLLSLIQQRQSFLMVGTVEPRKGHTQVLDAFENLWRKNTEVNLIIVGKQGWMVDVLVDRLRQHAEIGKHLFWLEGISDEYLEKVYAASTCLIAASYGEGFGLPLIEAAQHKVPIMCRDIPVFREVACEHAHYFVARNGYELAYAIEQWLSKYKLELHQKSDKMPWLTWKQSTDSFTKLVLS